MPALQMTNFKVSWKVGRLFPLLKDWEGAIRSKRDVLSVVSHSNFIIVRLSPECKGVYTIFLSGFINCTGLVNHQHCVDAIHRFKKWFDLARVEHFKIDCISAHSNLGRSVVLQDIENNTDLIADIHFTPELFAGCLIRFRSELNGSAYVFGNGKVTLVGAKSQRDVHRIYAAVLLILNTSACRGDEVVIVAR